MTQEQLNEKIKLHKLWLDNHKTGSQLIIKGEILQNLNFDGEDLSLSSFILTEIDNVDFSNSNLAFSIFENSIIRNSMFENAMIKKSSFFMSHLTYCQFDLATMVGANCNKTYIYSCSFDKTDLSESDFNSAFIKNINFNNTVLNSSSFINADLQRVGFNRAYSENAWFVNTQLDNCNFKKTSLNFASFEKAVLEYTTFDFIKKESKKINFTNAVIRDMNILKLKDAIFNGVNISPDLSEGFRCGRILKEPMIGYKKGIVIRSPSRITIIKLEIPKGAVVFSINGDKCRTNVAKVISIVTKNKRVSLNSCVSDYDNNFKYVVGETVEPESFNLQYNIECIGGIHFFKTEKEARKY